MSRIAMKHDRSGIALALTLLVILVVGAVSTSAAILGSNAWLINHYDERQSILASAADAGLEEARARLNGNSDLFPDTGYALLENGDPAEDAAGDAIPGVRRYTYVGPTGSTTGQYGIFGNIVVVAEDANGDRVIRRQEVLQESFARFAYFTDSEGNNIYFGGGDVIQGPLHTNDDIQIHSSRATFKGPVTTARTISGRNYGTFEQGSTERAPRIEMPDLADLQELEGYATDANLVFTSEPGGGTGETTMRIEFVAVDLNADGDSIDANEGFIKVYEVDDPDDARFVVAGLPPDYDDEVCVRWNAWGSCTDYEDVGLSNSPNCGHEGSHSEFYTAAEHSAGTETSDDWMASIRNGGRCHLGGSDPLAPGDAFAATDAYGDWLRWPDVPVASVIQAARPDDGAYLFPISRELNPEFQGVIYVRGKVAVSGVVRGHVTLAATGDIIIADDITYATDVGSEDRSCDEQGTGDYDILGLFSGGSIIVADNTINAPKRPRPQGSGNDYETLDDTPYETIDATVLTLNSFIAQNHDQGPDDREKCGGVDAGRGCLIVNGGIIQGTRGVVGLVGGTGYIKRYSYDVCASRSPPPYFPTTGHFTRSRYFEVGAVGFDPARYFDF